MDSIDSVFVLTSEVNEACGCHPEYHKETIGAFTSHEAASTFEANAPKTNAQGRTIYYDIQEIFILG